MATNSPRATFPVAVDCGAALATPVITGCAAAFALKAISISSGRHHW
jgi:hypothetical protein